MGNEALKISIGEGRDINITPEEMIAHDKVEALKSRYLKGQQGQNFNIKSIDNISRDPRNDEMEADFDRIFGILTEIEKKIKIAMKVKNRSEEVRLRGEERKLFNDFPYINQRWKGNNSSTGDSFRNVINKHKEIISMDK